MSDINVFSPAQFSLAENAFLSQHLGEPSSQALKEASAGVNPKAVKPILDRVFELLQMEQRMGESWAGIGKLKASIEAYLLAAARWSADRRRNRPRFPSMFAFNSRGQAFLSGTGSDAQIVNTYFTEDGKRQSFVVELVDSGIQEYAPDWTGPQLIDTIVLDEAKSRLECSVCAHTEQFKPESRGSFNAARARISRHLRTAKDETTRHRELHTLEFGSTNGSA